MQRTRLSEMAWVDCREAFRTRKLAVVPVGSTEQHGPVLPVGTDWMIAQYLADKAAEKLPESVVTPVIPIGNAFYHSDFAGTLAVPSNVLADYITAFCSYLIKYGVTHILFVNGHGGNMVALDEVAYHFRDLGVPVATIQWWDVAGRLNPKWGMIGHGDVFETSIMLAINPRIVNMERAKMPSNKSLGQIKLQDLHIGQFEKGIVHLSLRTSDVTDTGDFIEYGHSATADYSVSPADATAEMGQEILDAVVDYIVRFAKEFQKVSFGPAQ